MQDIRTSRHHKPLPIFFPTVRAPVVPRIFHHRPFLKGTPIAPALSWTMCPWLAGGFRVSDRFGMSWNQKPDDNSLYIIYYTKIMFHGFLILWSGLSTATAATKLVELFCILDKSKRWFFVHVWNALVPPFFWGTKWVTTFFVLKKLPVLFA